MKFSRLTTLAWAAVFSLLICGCGDTFRPVATPLPQPFPDPQSFRFAVMTACQLGGQGLTSCNPAGVTSQASDINVSGDTVDGVVPVGLSPVFALVQNNGITAQVTTADFDNDTISQHVDQHSITAGQPVSVSAPTTIGLPPGAHPISLANAAGFVYVAEFGRRVVGVLGGFPLALQSEIQVGANPVNLAALPSGSKIYVVNRGDNSVTVVSTADNNAVATIPVGSSPVWAVPSADGSRVFVVNQGSGTVSLIDATSDSVIATLTVGASPNYAVFDARNQRVVVTNPGSNTVSVINADPTSPAFKNVTNVAVGSNPVSVTALADGTRLYVANRDSNSVSVINSLSLAVSKTISLSSTISAADQTPSPVWIASDSESLKVFTANRDSRNASVILTSTDSELPDANGKPIRIPAPNIDPTDSTCTTTSCRLSPVFIAVGG